MSLILFAIAATILAAFEIVTRTVGTRNPFRDEPNRIVGRIIAGIVFVAGVLVALAT